MLKIYRKMHNVFVMFIILFLYAGCENFDLQESFLDTASNSYTITEYAYRLQGSTTLDVLTLSDTLPLCITWNGSNVVMEITPPTSSSTFRSLYQFDLEEGSTFIMTRLSNLSTYYNDTEKTYPTSKSMGIAWYNNKYYVCGSKVTSSNSAYHIIEQNGTSWNKDLWTLGSYQYPGLPTTYMADNRGIVFINDTLVNVGVTGYLLPLNADLLSYTTDDGFNKAASIGSSERPVTDACWADNYLWITANRSVTSTVEPKIYKYDYSGKTIKSTIKLPSTYNKIYGICYDNSNFWLLARRNDTTAVLLKMTM